MSAPDSTLEPIVAGFDDNGVWHDGGNGRFAKRGWSSAKALALRAIRGAFAREVAKDARNYGDDSDKRSHLPVWLEAADDYLSRIGVAKGHAVQVRYLDDTYGAIDAVQPDGSTRPVKVKWERFADHLPAAPDEPGWLADLFDGDIDADAAVDAAHRLFTGPIDGGYATVATTAVPTRGAAGPSIAVSGVIAHEGEKVGTFSRTLKYRDGAAIVVNETLKLVPEHQNVGVGSRFLARSNQRLAEAGVERVEVFAVSAPSADMPSISSNGAYTWARAGFQWDRRRKPVDIGHRILAVDPDNTIGQRLVADGDDFPTPNEVAKDPTGRTVLLGLDNGSAVGWDGYLPLSRPPAERIDAPAVRRNTTKADKGVGVATAARIKAAGGTGQATVADGYLARHGHPKGSTATVTWVDDTYADVHPAEPGGRTIRSKWSHFADDAPETPGGDPLRSPAGYVLEPDDRWEAYDSSGGDTPAEYLAVTPEREAAIRAATWHHGTINPEWMSNDGWTHVGSLAAAEHRAKPRNPGDVDYDPTGKPSTIYDVRLKPDARIAPVMTEDYGEITWDTPTGPYDVVPYWNVTEDPGSMSLLVRPSALEPVEAPGLDRPTPTVAAGAFDPARPTDATILDWVNRDGLVFPESEAMELHSAKLSWLFEEAKRRGMTDDEGRAAVFAIDGAIDRSSETLGWTRDALVAAVDRVNAGIVETDLDRGVVLQKAFTDAVWQARYGDAATISLSRIVSHDDPDRSMPGIPVKGVSSWVVRENEQQVIDWFAYRDLTPEVIRSDIDRDRVLMLPWGEGRYRSNYVRIHGETLVGPADPATVNPRDTLLDPDASADDIAAALYTGTSPGGNRVKVRSVTDRIVTDGPAHAPSSRRIIRVVAALYDNDPDWVDADGNPGREHKFSQVITVAPAADGGAPHVSIFLESGGDDLWHDVEMFTDDMARRVGADQATSFSPGGDIRSDLRQFINDGWAFHPVIDPYVIRSLGADLAMDHPGNPIALAWRDWDGNNVADIPTPQDAIANPELRSDALARLSYLGIKSYTGRRAVPELPRPGGYIDWADAPHLPDGTIVEFDVSSVYGTPRTTRFTVHDGKLLGRLDKLSGAAVNYDEAVAKAAAKYSGPPGRDQDGRFPIQVKVIRYKAAPLPQLDDTPPDPTPGVEVPDGTVPALALVRPGMVMPRERTSSLHPGTLVRRVMESDTPSGAVLPFYADGGSDYRVQGSTLVPVDGPQGPNDGRTGRYIVTAVPARPSGLPDTGPPPTEFDVRAREALMSEARDLMVSVDDSEVASYAVGAVWPTDWVAAGTIDPDATVPSKVMASSLRNYLAYEYPGGAHGGEAIGPLWRVPGRGMTNYVMWTDSPIEGVEPETITVSRVEGALGDGDGYMLFGRSPAATPWREPARTPLDDDAVAERIAALRLPTQPDGDLNVRDSWASMGPTADSLAWLSNPNASLVDGRGMVEDANIPGMWSATGPIQAVRFTRDPERGNKRIVQRFRYPIGSPEMELAGWDPSGDDLILSIDDPRLPEAIDNAWWENETRAGTVARVEAEFIVTGHSNPAPGDIEPRISRALKAQSDKLLTEATNDDGTVNVEFRDGRYILTPAGKPVAAANVTHARPAGDGSTQVHLNRAGAVEAVGEEGVTPDYTVVHEDWRPWDERVAALAAQRSKLLARFSSDGSRLDHLFARPTDSIETGAAPVTAEHQEQIDRAVAVAEYGRGIAALMHARSSEIDRDPDRSGTYTGGDRGNRRPPQITERHAKALTKIMREVEKEWAAPFDNDTVRLILDKITQGRVHVEHTKGKDLDLNNPIASLDSVTISTQRGLIDRKRGPWTRIYFKSDGHVHTIEVHADQASRFDTERYKVDGLGGKPVGKRLTKLARDIGLVSAADPRPSLGELAFLETMEALGHDMSTNPDLKISGASGTGTLGRSTSPEVYAAKLGLNIYPRDWTDRLPEQTIQFGTDDFATAGGGWNRGGRTVHIADPRLYPQHRDTIVHEFGHSFEDAIPGLPAAEAWYLTHRVLASTGPTTPKFIGNILGRDAYSFTADLTRDYTGRVYNTSTITDNSNYEVFTTAMEQIVNRGTGRRGVEDMGLTSWVMGILGLIRPEATT